LGSDGEPLPTLRDLTIKASVPKDRVLATFKCPISYAVPYEIEHDRKKVQSRRDGEVLRVKKHYLKLYLATRGIHSVSSPVGSDLGSSHLKRTSSSSSTGSSAPVPVAASPAAPSAESSRARSKTCSGAELDLSQPASPLPPPRKRARTASGSFLRGEDEWRQLCPNARSLHCETLPGLEEAARMFGFVTP
jgi:hypothetical protein